MLVIMISSEDTNSDFRVTTRAENSHHSQQVDRTETLTALMLLLHHSYISLVLDFVSGWL